MNKNNESEQKLEQALHQALRSVPLRRAPLSLEARVMNELARRATKPWWQANVVLKDGFFDGELSVEIDLFVEADGVQIKIEVTPVLRGCVYEPETLSVSRSVEAHFGLMYDLQHPKQSFGVVSGMAKD